MALVLNPTASVTDSITVSSTGGPYTITYTYTDGNTCSASSTAQVEVLLATGVTPLATISNSISLSPNPNNGVFTLNVKANTKFLRFTIDDDMFPPLSVKALTISNSEVDINTNNDTIVIVVGKHSFNGKDVGERKIIHYRIMDQDKDSANVIHSGIATISTPETCRVVYIEKK